MTREVEVLVMDLIRRHLQAEGGALDGTTRFVEDLGADSLALVELTLVLEETFDIDISEEEAAGLRSVRDAIVSVERCLQAQHPA
jgi:acyl carrier protein